MRQFGLHIIILTLLTACSNGTTSVNKIDQHSDIISETTTELIKPVNSDDSNQADPIKQNNWVPDKSEIINPKYSTDFLFKSWAHKSTDDKPAIKIDKEFFRVKYGDTIADVKYIVKRDSIKIFEYHHGQTSKGTILKLTADSLIISWSTGDKNRYVTYEK